MAFERAFIDINIAVDLDSVAGNFDKTEDFVTFIEQTLKQAIHHYKPEVTTKSITLKPYVWNEEKMEYIQPQLEGETRKPKVGDRTFSLEDGSMVIKSLDFSLSTYSVIISNKQESRELLISNLTWNESENRWEYGDLERK